MSLIAMPRRTDPSWKAGFARSAAKSANPGLWKGLRASWTPSLGPTGSTLFDVSGSQRHGALTNMDPSVDWNVGEKGWMLSNEGVNDHAVIVPDTSQYFTGWAGLSIVFRFRWRPSDGGDANFNWLFDKNFGNPFAATITVSSDALLFYINGTAGASVASAVLRDTWATYALTYDGANKRYFRDGKLLAAPVASALGPLNSNTVSVSIFARESGTDRETAGDLSALHVYDRALHPNEIQQLFQDPVAPLRLRRRVFSAAAAVGGILVHPGMDGLHADLSGGMRG